MSWEKIARSIHFPYKANKRDQSPGACFAQQILSVTQSEFWRRNPPLSLFLHRYVRRSWLMLSFSFSSCLCLSLLIRRKKRWLCLVWASKAQLYASNFISVIGVRHMQLLFVSQRHDISSRNHVSRQMLFRLFRALTCSGVVSEACWCHFPAPTWCIFILFYFLPA